MRHNFDARTNMSQFLSCLSSASLCVNTVHFLPGTSTKTFNDFRVPLIPNMFPFYRPPFLKWLLHFWFKVYLFLLQLAPGSGSPSFSYNPLRFSDELSALQSRMSGVTSFRHHYGNCCLGSALEVCLSGKASFDVISGRCSWIPICPRRQVWGSPIHWMSWLSLGS